MVVALPSSFSATKIACQRHGKTNDACKRVSSLSSTELYKNINPDLLLSNIFNLGARDSIQELCYL